VLSLLCSWNTAEYKKYKYNTTVYWEVCPSAYHNHTDQHNKTSQHSSRTYLCQQHLTSWTLVASTKVIWYVTTQAWNQTSGDPGGLTRYYCDITLTASRQAIVFGCMCLRRLDTFTNSTVFDRQVTVSASRPMYKHQTALPRPKVIQDLNPDFQLFNYIRIPVSAESLPKCSGFIPLSFISPRFVKSVRRLYNKMLMNLLKCPILQCWEKWKSYPDSVSGPNSPHW